MNTVEKLRFLAEMAETGEVFLCGTVGCDSWHKQKFVDGNLYMWSHRKNWETTSIKLDIEEYERSPWVPINGDQVWLYDSRNDDIVPITFSDVHILHLTAFLSGALFRNEDEADANAKRIFLEKRKEYEVRKNENATL